MSSFSCQHYRVADDYCLLLKTDCVPGRKGCVLKGTCKFAVPAEERVRLKEAEKQSQRDRMSRQTRSPGMDLQ